MAKQIEGVYEAVLACAKKEFLEKGYTDASLRTIAQEAGTSTSSIYTRFKDKEGLFEAIVGPASLPDERNVSGNSGKLSWAGRGGSGSGNGPVYHSRHQMELLDFIYEHFEEFYLLINGAGGSRFASFLDELVQIEVDYTYKYMEVIGCETVKSGLVTEEFLHIIVTAYFNGMFEVVRHRMPKADAVKYIRLLNRYHMQGLLADGFSGKEYSGWQLRARSAQIGPFNPCSFTSLKSEIY